MSDIAIQVESVSKIYRIYAYPRARLTGSLALRLSREPLLPEALRRRLRNFAQTVCREFHALRDVSLTVERGSAVGVVGRNGSGKSTLLQIITGVLQPTSGRVEVRGRVAALLELGSAFNPEFTGRENVQLNASLLGLSPAEITERFPAIEAFAGIGDFIEQPVKTYSSGMMVRLAFAVQTAVDPEILIVDEALAVGDETFQRKCFARLEQLRAAGTTILFVSHDAGAVVNLCTSACFLHHGVKVLEGEPKYVVSRYQRFCHAPDPTAEAALRLILQEVEQDRATDAAEAASSAGNGAAVAPETGPEGEAASLLVPALPSQLEGYDPQLQPQSTTRYQSLGAEIFDVEIVNDRNQRVNQLVRRRRYTYRYRVRFHQACREVAFAMLIKTPRGQELGGCTSNGRLLAEVPAGSVYLVRFHFQCLLAPWLYFLNAGVEGWIGDKRAYVDRIIDAHVFRVLPERNLSTTALVDFLIEPEFETCPTSAPPAS